MSDIWWQIDVIPNWCLYDTNKSVASKKRKRKMKHALLLWDDVPHEFRVPSYREKTDKVPRNRCIAATRPWLNGMGKRGQYHRCDGTTSNGNELCGWHSKVFREAGSTSWDKEIGDLS